MAVAFVVVRLKLALVAGGLRASGITGIVGTLFAVVVACSVGGMGALLFGLVRFVSDQVAMEVAVGGFGFVLFLWAFGPIATATSDGTLDVDQLAVFPLAAPQLMPGLLGASIAGFGGLATVITFAGAFVGLAPLSPLAVLTALAVALELATCVTFGRLLGTVMSGAARNRRWRDIVLFAGPAVAIGINLLIQFAVRDSFGESTGTAPSLEDNAFARGLLAAARLLPSGPAAMAAGFARAGRVLPSVAALLAGTLVLFAGLALWYSALERTLSSAGAGTSGRSRRRAAGRPRDLYPAALAWALPENRVGAVAAKELRVTARDPRQRMAMMSSLFIVALSLISVRAGTWLGSPEGVLFLLAPAYGASLTATNLFGFDGTAHWMNVAAGDDIRRDLLGKWVARLAFIVPVLGLVAWYLVARAGSATYLVPALALAFGLTGTSLGVGSALSVRLPFPMPTSKSNVFSSGNAGRGSLAAILSIVVLPLQVALFGPLAVAVAVFDGVGVRIVVTVLGLAIGVGATLAGLWYAVRWSGPRQPELLLALEPKQT